MCVLRTGEPARVSDGLHHPSHLASTNPDVSRGVIQPVPSVAGGDLEGSFGELEFLAGEALTGAIGRIG